VTSGRARRGYRSDGVLAEVVVFVVAAPTLLRGPGPAGAAALAASAGIVRWSVTAVTAWLPAERAQSSSICHEFP
jgi:hypothetical protein